MLCGAPCTRQLWCRLEAFSSIEVEEGLKGRPHLRPCNVRRKSHVVLFTKILSEFPIFLLLPVQKIFLFTFFKEQNMTMAHQSPRTGHCFLIIFKCIATTQRPYSKPFQYFELTVKKWISVRPKNRILTNEDSESNSELWFFASIANFAFAFAIARMYFCLYACPPHPTPLPCVTNIQSPNV